MNDPSNLWPTPKFRFVVNIGGDEIFFQEVSGLDVETQPIEYRHGDSKQFSTIKMPGLRKYGNITMKRGVFSGDSRLREYFEAGKMNSAKAKKVTISLLDESNAVVMSWTLNNALPVKIQSADLKADGNEVAIETLELSHEGLSVEK